VTRVSCVLVVLATTVALAQTPHSYTTPGFLKAWVWEGASGDLAHGGATATERKALVSKMLELRERLKASPVGHFEPFSAPDRPDLQAGNFPLSALIWFGAFPAVRRTWRCCRASTGRA